MFMNAGDYSITYYYFEREAKDMKVCCLQAGLTSLQGPFGDFVAVGAPARSVVSRDLDLVIGPDDELLQQQTGLVRVRDVFHLAINWKP